MWVRISLYKRMENGSYCKTHKDRDKLFVCVCLSLFLFLFPLVCLSVHRSHTVDHNNPDPLRTMDVNLSGYGQKDTTCLL